MARVAQSTASFCRSSSMSALMITIFFFPLFRPPFRPAPPPSKLLPPTVRRFPFVCIGGEIRDGGGGQIRSEADFSWCRCYGQDLSFLVRMIFMIQWQARSHQIPASSSRSYRAYLINPGLHDLHDLLIDHNISSLHNLDLPGHTSIILVYMVCMIYG